MTVRTKPIKSQQSIIDYRETPVYRVKTEHFIPILTKAIEDAGKIVAEVRNKRSEPTLENTLLPLELANEEIDRINNNYRVLHLTESDPELIKLAQEIASMLAQYHSMVLTDKIIFEKIKAIYDKEVKGNQRPQLPGDLNDKEALIKGERYRYIETSYWKFVWNGAFLSDDKKQKLGKLKMEISKLLFKFYENMLNATNDFELHLTKKEEIEGIPDNILSVAAALAKKRKKAEGWLLTLNLSIFLPVLKNCRNRYVREVMYKAYRSRAFRDKFDNQETIMEIVRLRNEKAKILGYNNYAEYVLQGRMAESVENVEDFLNRLCDISYPVAKKNIEDITEFASKQDGIQELMPWDHLYYANSLLKERYHYDSEELRPYFRLESVIEGIFTISNKLYGVTFVPVFDAPVYHSDVKTYRVFDEDNRYLGLLYLDLLPRETKKSDKYVMPIQTQGMYSDGPRRTQVAIICSLTPPVDELPSLLHFDEVYRLFQLFGKSLYMLLSECHYKRLAAPNIPGDFRELPALIMENWLFEKESLKLFAKHYITNEPIPENVLDNIIAAKNFDFAVKNLVQVRYSLLDFAWSKTDPDQISDVDVFEKNILEQHQVIPEIEGTNFSCSFEHIFASHYAAGYYSFKWGESLEADAWMLFKENGIFNKEVAKSFREKIIARGNSYHPMDLFTAFRGRKPDPQAMLVRRGLID